MPQVKKREQPEVEPVIEEELTIRVGGRDYPVPHLTWKQYKAVLKVIELNEEQLKEMTETESHEQMIEFYYKLLKPHHAELKKSDFEEFPIYQLGAEFFFKLKMQLFRVPLA